MNYVPGSPDADERGHGTHVAGVIAGKTYGVSKRATVVAVKVTDKNGDSTVSRVLQGLGWVIADAKERGITDTAVINMSFSGSRSSFLNLAVDAAAKSGMTVVVAAGNRGSNATDYSPASVAGAVTVGAIDKRDERVSSSNFGESVDMFAPGVGILSAAHESDSAARYMSGTSMATPYVAGLAACFIAKNNLRGAPIADCIRTVAGWGVGDGRGSADRIAYNANP